MGSLFRFLPYNPQVSCYSEDRTPSSSLWVSHIGDQKLGPGRIELISTLYQPRGNESSGLLFSDILLLGVTVFKQSGLHVAHHWALHISVLFKMFTASS